MSGSSEYLVLCRGRNLINDAVRREGNVFYRSITIDNDDRKCSYVLNYRPGPAPFFGSFLCGWFYGSAPRRRCVCERNRE